VDHLIRERSLDSGGRSLYHYCVLSTVRPKRFIHMYIRIEKGASAPISRQIAEQIRAQCLAGLLKAGQSLPSVRQLARELLVNVNTVVRVYERLAAEGLIEMRHGDGTFVLPQAASTDGAAELKIHREQFSREFQGIVRRGLMAGLTLPELRRMLTEAVADAREQISKSAQFGDSI
jgi:GntR family transcriptional regulator